MALKESLLRRVLAWGVGLIAFAIGAAANVAVVGSKVEAEIKATWGEPIVCTVTPEGEQYYDGGLALQKVEVRCPQFTTKVPMSPEDSEKPGTNMWIRDDSIFIAGDWSHGGDSKPPVRSHWWETLLMVYLPLTAVFSVFAGVLFNLWLRKRNEVQT